MNGVEISSDRSFPAHPSALSEIRSWVRASAAEASLSAETTEELGLAVNEAATNALLHSGTRRIDLRWAADDSTVQVEVLDDGIFRRRVRIPEIDGPGGYGIPLMMSLVDEVEIKEGTARRPGTAVRLVKKLRH